VKSKGGKQPGKQHDLIILHQLCIGAEGHVFWHAVDAAQVAVIGEADPQVRDVTSELI
jgi:hypothetical protein